MMYPSISIHKATRLDDLEKIAIEGVSLITYEHSNGSSGRHKYVCSYDGAEAFVIESCSELPQQTLAMLFEHISIFE